MLKSFLISVIGRKLSARNETIDLSKPRIKKRNFFSAALIGFHRQWRKYGNKIAPVSTNTPDSELEIINEINIRANTESLVADGDVSINGTDDTTVGHKQELLVYMRDKVVDPVDISESEIYLACAQGDLDYLQLVVNAHGIDLNKVRDLDGQTPLMVAVSSSQEKVVLFLLQLTCDDGIAPRVDLFLRDGVFGRTALMHAAELGNSTIVRLLVEHDLKLASIDLKDKVDSKTALMFAAEGGFLEIVQYLVGKTASVTLKDRYERTALMWASIGNKLEVMTYLASFIQKKNCDYSLGNDDCSHDGFGSAGLFLYGNEKDDAADY